MEGKGVTPIIATTLLFGIAISAVVSATFFMQNTLDDVKEGFSDDIRTEQIREKADITIEFGYDRSDYLMIDLRNSGDISLPLKKDTQELVSLYVGGRPDSDWYYLGDTSVLQEDEKITVNTTENFPQKGNYTNIQVNGPYETDSHIVCYNDGDSSC